MKNIKNKKIEKTHIWQQFFKSRYPEGHFFEKKNIETMTLVGCVYNCR